MDVWEVHFKAVLSLVRLDGHGREFGACGVESGDGSRVDVEWAERGRVGVAERECEGVEVEVVGGSEDEDAFAGLSE